MEALSLGEPTLISMYLAPYTGKTLTAYYKTMFNWLAWCIDARVHLIDAGRVHIEQWIRHLRTAEKNQKRTVNTKLTVVCGFYRWCHEEGYTTYNHAAFVRRPDNPRRSNLKWLSKPQAEDLLAASRELGPPWDGFFHLELLNGIRLTETITADIEHLGHIEEHTTLWMPMRKKGVMDTISLPTETIEVLDGCIGKRETGPLLRLKANRLTQSQVYTTCNRISDVCGLDFRIRPHMLRASFVTLSLDAGADIRDVMASMGVSSTAMVHYYDRAHASIRRNTSHRVAKYLQE